MRERDHLEDQSRDKKIMKLMLKKSFWMAWAGFVSLRTGIGGGLLWTR
jgi:hypothetical protein